MEYIVGNINNYNKLLKRFIGNDIYKSVNGKPYVKNHYIGISHSNNYLLLAKSHDDFGIDIEKIRNINYKWVKHWFSKNELLNIKSNKDFFRTWVLKEAYIKLIDGNYDNYNDIEIDLNNLNKNKDFNLSLIEEDDYIIGICYKKKA